VFKLTVQIWAGCPTLNLNCLFSCFATEARDAGAQSFPLIFRYFFHLLHQISLKVSLGLHFDRVCGATVRRRGLKYICRMLFDHGDRYPAKLHQPPDLDAIAHLADMKV